MDWVIPIPVPYQIRPLLSFSVSVPIPDQTKLNQFQANPLNPIHFDTSTLDGLFLKRVVFRNGSTRFCTCAEKQGSCISANRRFVSWNRWYRAVYPIPGTIQCDSCTIQTSKRFCQRFKSFWLCIESNRAIRIGIVRFRFH